ncbi:hypothetical protein ABI59_14245 [Acidobacteria bacterium Mor1]|nr:hypothetical protein ABI59_14245 [Acidobacteria bacterium Mor1]
MISADADMIVMIDDFPRMQSNWERSPLARIFEDPDLQELFKPFREDMGLDELEESFLEETGMTSDEVFALFTGQMAIVLPDLKALDNEGEPTGDEPVLILAEIGKNRKAVEKLMAKNFEYEQKNSEDGVELEQVVEEFQGVKLNYVRQVSKEASVDSDFWAITEGFAFIAGTREGAQEAIAALKEGAERPLASAPGYSKMVQRELDNDMTFYLDVAFFSEMMQELIAEEAAASDEEGAEDPMAAMGMSTQGMVDAMGFENFEALYVGARLAEEATELNFGIYYKEESGLAKLLTAYGVGDLGSADFVPQDAVEATVASFSMGTFWTGLKEILYGMSPMVGGMMDGMLAQKKSEGIDIEQGLMESLGTTMVSAQFKVESGQPGEELAGGQMMQVFAMSVADRQSLEMTLEGIKSFGGAATAEMFEQRPFLDYTIYEMAMPSMDPEQPEGNSFAYVLTEDQFIVGMGGSAGLRNVLSSMQRPGKSVWDRKDVKAALAQMPGGAAALSFQDVAAFVETFVSAMQTAGEFASEDDSLEGFDASSIEALNELEKHFGIAVSGLYREDGGLHSVYRLMPPSR